MSGNDGEGKQERSSLVYEILEAVAEVRGEDLYSLPPIGNRLDPDALEQFVESTSGSMEVYLELYECSVLIDGEGSVMVSNSADE